MRQCGSSTDAVARPGTGGAGGARRCKPGALHAAPPRRREGPTAGRPARSGSAAARVQAQRAGVGLRHHPRPDQNVCSYESACSHVRHGPPGSPGAVDRLGVAVLADDKLVEVGDGQVVRRRLHSGHGGRRILLGGVACDLVGHRAAQHHCGPGWPRPRPRHPPQGVQHARPNRFVQYNHHGEQNQSHAQRNGGVGISDATLPQVAQLDRRERRLGCPKARRAVAGADGEVAPVLWPGLAVNIDGLRREDHRAHPKRHPCHQGHQQYARSGHIIVI
mmetsp:Transcript_925/g.3093  ORF Transcript_925/g.3093 Transcript_925/m.3093 type:complete len:276 (+) Transcript_925:824-1651(+)